MIVDHFGYVIIERKIMFVNKKKRRLARALELEKRHIRKTNMLWVRASKKGSSGLAIDLEHKLERHVQAAESLEQKIKSCRGPRLHGLP